MRISHNPLQELDRDMDVVAMAMVAMGKVGMVDALNVVHQPIKATPFDAPLVKQRFGLL
jgi:hypothetical protein